MKNVFISFSILSIAIFAGCKKNSPAPANTANVMFINGCAGTTNVNVTNNTTPAAITSNLAFQKNTGYLSLAPGTDSVTFVLTTIGTPLIANTSSYDANAHYSVYAGGLITAPSFVRLTDDLAAPAAGNAKIRFINISGDALSETATAGSTTIASGITAQSSSAFIEIAAGAYAIKAGDPANISTVVSLGTTTTQLSSGKIYTLMLTGTLPGTGTSYLSLTLINNN